jgi:hypothetical protein
MAGKMAIESKENWKILKIILSSREVTLAKMNHHTKTRTGTLLRSNKASFNATAAKMAKKSPENWKFLKFF